MDGEVEEEEEGVATGTTGITSVVMTVKLNLNLSNRKRSRHNAVEALSMMIVRGA